MIKTENIFSKYYNLLQTNIEIISQQQISSDLITGAIIVDRLIDQKIDEIYSVHQR